MNLPVLDIPENPQAWPQWLEGQLVGTTLGALVEQLAAVLETTSPGPSVEQLCGTQCSVVLERGLSALSAEQLRQFLKHPQRLLELQERILTDGGRYWQAKLDTPAAREEAARHWQRIEQQLTTARSVPIWASASANRGTVRDPVQFQARPGLSPTLLQQPASDIPQLAGPLESFHRDPMPFSRDPQGSAAWSALCVSCSPCRDPLRGLRIASTRSMQKLSRSPGCGRR